MNELTQIIENVPSEKMGEFTEFFYFAVSRLLIGETVDTIWTEWLNREVSTDE